MLYLAIWKFVFNKFCHLYFVEEMFLALEQNISVGARKKQRLGVVNDEWYAQVIATILYRYREQSYKRLSYGYGYVSKRFFLSSLQFT